jgi:hypothetical protein
LETSNRKVEWWLNSNENQFCSGWKPDESHDWMQGATNLQRALWSKPLKSGGTAGAEGVGHVAMADR